MAWARYNREMSELTRRAVLAGMAAAVRPARAEEAPQYAGAAELAGALAAGKFSARELLETTIRRIEGLDGPINAVVVRDFDRAHAAADAADAALARGERRGLLGVPVTVKEQFNVAGLPTCWGLERFRGWRAPADALTVQRLKAAGAIVIGKTNVPVGLSDWQSYNPVYGTTNNPWNRARTPGGSSGGAAAALACGFVPLELGSDLGGSLRAPAHFCGVFAHKPSLDLVPQRGGGYPGTPAVPVRGDMAVVGPMARSAADLQLELDILAGPDELWEGIGYRLALPPPRRERLADYRVLVLDAHPLCATAANVKGAIDTLSDRLEKAGCSVVRRHPAMPDLARTTRVYDELLAAFFSADLRPEERLRLEALASALAPEELDLPAAELRGFTLTHPAWIATSRIREAMRPRWQALFDEVDVLLCPPMPTPAFLHDHSRIEERTLEVDGRRIPYGNQVAWSAVATTNGLPATVAPIGRTEDGLPVGVQIVGGFLQDRTTIAFAGLLEREFGGFVRPPGF